ncbi:MAG: phospholipase/carboxylesterase [Thermoplasmata archaeon]|jgi:predicted esterase|nr:phospholipase/carboxylesterase [Thermoplasmata archaeon]
MIHEHVWQPVAGARRTLLMLHGTGGDEHDLVPLAAMLDPRANVLSPRGNALENGMPRFFARHGPGRLDLADLARRTRELAAFVREAVGSYRFAPEDVVVVGFSNGANIGAALLFEEPDVLAGAILIRAMLPYRPPAAPRVAGKRVLLLAGERDPYSQPEATEALAAILRDGGAVVEVHYAKAGHELTPRDVDVARRWLADRPQGS